MDEYLLSLWQKRYRRAVWVANCLRVVPFVRMIGLNGSLMTGQMTADSDIDFYIVTAANRLYLTRWLVTGVVHLTGWRRYGHRVRGRVCLNRFATVEAMNITPHNDYHARVFSQLLPLVSINQTYQGCLQANHWMEQLGQPVKVHRPQRAGFSWRTLGRGMGEWLLAGTLGDMLESWQQSWQQRRIACDPRTQLTSSLVRVSNKELCFHFMDKELTK